MKRSSSRVQMIRDEASGRGTDLKQGGTDGEAAGAKRDRGSDRARRGTPMQTKPIADAGCVIRPG